MLPIFLWTGSPEYKLSEDGRRERRNQKGSGSTVLNRHVNIYCNENIFIRCLSDFSLSTSISCFICSSCFLVLLQDHRVWMYFFRPGVQSEPNTTNMELVLLSRMRLIIMEKPKIPKAINEK